MHLNGRTAVASLFARNTFSFFLSGQKMVVMTRWSTGLINGLVVKLGSTVSENEKILFDFFMPVFFLLITFDFEFR